jgi:hypothetical protein
VSILEDAMAVATALNALKIKRGRFVGTHKGVEIHQPGKPVLLLTHEAAHDFANEIAEAEA